MSKKRYFYNDPLAGAWMAKHHGIRFANGDSLRSACEMVGINGADLESGGFYVHSKSGHLLKPQPGDIVTRKLGVVGAVGRGHDNDSVGVWWAGSEGKDQFDGNEVVIQRNGIAFINPESEDA